MLGRDRIIELLHNLTSGSLTNDTDQIEALYIGSHISTTRFADSTIIQNVNEANRIIYFRVLLDKRLGIASTNSLHAENLKRCIKKAVAVARQEKPLKFFDSLPQPSNYPNFKTHFSETAEMTIFDKIKILEGVFKKIRKEKLAAGGAFCQLEVETGVVNSNGVKAYQPFTSVNMNLIASSHSSSGFSSQFERNIKNMDIDKLISTATRKTVTNYKLQDSSKKLKKLKPGRYTVLLEPAAVAEILEWLIYIGFGTETFIDNTSFMSGNIGKRIMGKNMTIYDDGADPHGFIVPFDFEGVKKKRLDIIENGIARNIAYDTLFAKRSKIRSTGHARIPDDIDGPFPTNVFIKEGGHTIDEMVSMIEKGLIITRFHYVNGLLDTRSASMTGMTRDGTFYVEDGRIKYPVLDMRFTERILEAFSRIEAISYERQAFPTSWSNIGASVVPALLIRDFNFT